MNQVWGLSGNINNLECSISGKFLGMITSKVYRKHLKLERKNKRITFGLAMLNSMLKSPDQE
jgi:hypothetical protein